MPSSVSPTPGEGLVVAPGSRMIVARRAAGDAGSLVAILLTVLVVCSAVSGIVASLAPLQQQALTAALAEQPADDRVVEVVSTYDPEAPDPDPDVRAALAPVAAASGGTVVRRAETVAEVTFTGAVLSLITAT